LRNIQESLAEHEFVVGNFYWKRDMNPAAANRLNAMVDQFPLYSGAGEALFEAGDAYSKMGPRFRKTSADMFGRIVQDYPLCQRAEDAKQRLQDMEMPVPKVDQAAADREKYDEENYHRPGMMARSMGWMHSGPDVGHAAKSGQPTMTDPKRTIPASVPVANNTDNANGSANGSGTTDVSASTVGKDSALDTKPDARTNNGTDGAAAAKPAASTPPAASNQPLPTNRDAEMKKYRERQLKKQQKLEKKKKKSEKPETPAAAAPAAPASATPATGTGTPAAAPAGAPPSAPQE
jgi:hypothetical protein